MREETDRIMRDLRPYCLVVAECGSRACGHDGRREASLSGRLVQQGGAYRGSQLGHLAELIEHLVDLKQVAWA